MFLITFFYSVYLVNSLILTAVFEKFLSTHLKILLNYCLCFLPYVALGLHFLFPVCVIKQWFLKSYLSTWICSSKELLRVLCFTTLHRFTFIIPVFMLWNQLCKASLLLTSWYISLLTSIYFWKDHLRDLSNVYCSLFCQLLNSYVLLLFYCYYEKASCILDITTICSCAWCRFILLENGYLVNCLIFRFTAEFLIIGVFQKMISHDMLEDNITLKVGHSNKQKKASIKLIQNQNMIELHLILRTVAGRSTFISAKKSCIFNFQHSSEKFTEFLKEQIGRSGSHIEVNRSFR